MSSGNKVSGKTTIPVGEMAKDNLDKIFPNLTPEQVKAIKAGEPVPPSPGYAGTEVRALRPMRDEGDVARIQDLRVKLDEAQFLLAQKIRLEGLFDATVAGMKGMPLVTCILVFQQKNRVRRARKAVQQFFEQSYPNKQLVIVNNTDLPITNVTHRTIKEIPVDPLGDAFTTGQLRNMAIDAADGEVLCPHWDDDDVYDKHLLAYMMAHYTPGKAVLLSSQIRVDIKNSAAYMHVQPDGIPNTMVVPHVHARYQSQTGGEDVLFWNMHWAMKSVVVDNTAWPANTLKMVVWDGNNVLDADKFMVDHATPDHFGRWELGANEAEHMKAALGTFGLKAEPKTHEEIAAGALA